MSINNAKKDIVLPALHEFAGKLSINELALHCNVSVSTITSYASRSGICLKVNDRVQKRKDIEQYILKHHHEKTISEISRDLNIPGGTIHYYGKLFGVAFKKVRKWGYSIPKNVNSDYFNEHARKNWLV